MRVAWGISPSPSQQCACLQPDPAQPWHPPHAPCAIPSSQEDVVGLRTPYLDTDTAVREVLHQNGFLYEAALIEDW